MLPEKITKLLGDKEFITVATCDFGGRPNAAPKFILKSEGNCIYLVDYTIGRTWENLKVNPRASLSFMDQDTLIGYQINGSVEIIDIGLQHDALFDEFRRKEIDLSVRRIVEGISRGKKHETFEVSLPERFVVFKIKLEDWAEIGPSGELKREKV
ncbi:MAG: pyridoxamine 5'-phosphate oxidase family protein [Candidatus Omnitrophica bacterium]|jgi:hypothetical protein|nr:pyridoxamine 5'-phosphate oxidase family protein [Candidatus Omnitrophota bacterium]